MSAPLSSTNNIIVTNSNPIGIFDSGVGGLSVLREIKTLLPAENLIYIADQAHVPYGPRSITEIRQFSQAIIEFLCQQDAKMIVVACNTATAAALTYLRETFPHISFVGMEPAVKPAAQQTKTGNVGVLATAATIKSERYADLMHRFAQNVTVFEDPCIGLVRAIEAGEIDTPSTTELLQSILTPMQTHDVDTFVLGCTHYPFVLPIIKQIVGTAVSIIDPAPAVALQTKRILEKEGLLNITKLPSSIRFITTGEQHQLEQFVQHVLHYKDEVETAVWHNDQHLHSNR